MGHTGQIYDNWCCKKCAHCSPGYNTKVHRECRRPDKHPGYYTSLYYNRNIEQQDNLTRTQTSDRAYTTRETSSLCEKIVKQARSKRLLARWTISVVTTTNHHFTAIIQINTHTHPFNGPFPGLPGWTGTRKVKPIWILLKQETVSGSGISWAVSKSTLSPVNRHL